jgi:hypothetical protein
MAKTIPCPNPACTHDFSMAEVQATAQLLCPKCGFRMKGKGPAQPQAAAPAAKPPSKPAAPPAVKPAAPASAKTATPAAAKKPAPAMPTPAPPKVVHATGVQTKPAVPSGAAASPPLAKPIPAQPKPAAAPGPPLAKPIAAPPSAAAATDITSDETPAATPAGGEGSLPGDTFFHADFGAATGTLVRTGTTKKKFKWMRLLIILFAVGFAVCIVIAAVGGLLIWLLPGLPGVRDVFTPDGDSYLGKIHNSKNESETVYKLVLPKKSWSVDSEIARRFDAHAAWKSADYDFWFALCVKDYGMHRPRDAEMLRLGIGKLEAHFGADMELDAKVQAVTFGALPAQKLRFRGVVKEAKWLGDCYVFFSNGIAYWLFIASPDEKVIDQFAAELPEKHVFVVSDRRGWREQPPPTESFASTDGQLDMTAPKQVWEKGIDPKNVEPNGILSLTGRYRRQKDPTKNAHLIVFTMEKKDNLEAALKAAREHLETKEKDINERAKIMHAAEDGQTDSAPEGDVGNRRGRTVDLKLQIGDEPEPQRYYLLAVVNEPDVCYAILCECSWKSRPIWRQDFLDVLRTLRLK